MSYTARQKGSPVGSIVWIGKGFWRINAGYFHVGCEWASTVKMSHRRAINLDLPVIKPRSGELAPELFSR